ncbi:TPA: hypothetical protein ACPSKZ_000668 [Legionella anisa]|uniref:hypothetical protein n=1 Tax=Legionella anisa TaxID=28082 RepID=UPI0022431E1C|nr:hypothetical protein [Legionella anisa]MCW8425634.1 hypothetical protein [Legionella anisa]MCW8448937.1 hypothetical protein [Legionella anisa]
MSLFSSIILPQLERELVRLEPQIAQFLVGQLKKVASEVVEWAESKTNVDINGDGKVGESE